MSLTIINLASCVNPKKGTRHLDGRSTYRAIKNSRRNFNFTLPEYHDEIPREYINSWNALVDKTTKHFVTDLSNFRIADANIKRKTEDIEIPNDSPYADFEETQYRTQYTGETYCSKAVFESKLKGLQGFVRVMLLPPEQEAIKVKGFANS